ncbi:FHA domain-containing protein [uncultured Tolumonas sp.]|uniref:FHA domain-containing protein n=1 Tax=uncultured Tolumonas sp. TaxID=263765 RepID=UPI002931E621|nr:FHA domain-containing protein [uncultured Tolumonas sp.]
MTTMIALLRALTPEAQEAIGGAELAISRFPFRVGRESRGELKKPTELQSRRKPDSVPNNDLYLVETDPELNVSREHFQIDFQDGDYAVSDRGSYCGTLVEGEVIGGRRTGASRRLMDNDVIIVGTSRSRYVFKFILRPGQD